jgi:hypothetical protein
VYLYYIELKRHIEGVSLTYTIYRNIEGGEEKRGKEKQRQHKTRVNRL